MNKDEIKTAVLEAMAEHNASFYINPQKHFMDHVFVSEVRTNSKVAKGVAFKLVITALVGLAITVIVRGWNG